MFEYCVSVKPVTDATWEAEDHLYGHKATAVDGSCSNAYLTAACRAIVASKLGEYVDIPDELLEAE
jgi:hypothetical protein